MAEAIQDKLTRLRCELEQTEALLRLPRVQGDAREVLDKLKSDLKIQIALVEAELLAHLRPANAA